MGLWIPDYFDLAHFQPSIQNISFSLDSTVVQNLSYTKRGQLVLLRFNEALNASASSVPAELVLTELVNPVAALKAEYISKYGVFSGQFLLSYVKLTLYVAFFDTALQK